MKKFTLILLLLAAFSLGCKLSSLSPGNGGSSGSGADPKADVIEACRKLRALESFSSSATTEGVDQTEMKSRIDYVAPDRYYITILAGAGAGMELIMIGNKSFMKIGGKWSKMPDDWTSSIPTLGDSFTEEGLKTLDEVKYEGEDTADGKPARVYTYKNVTLKGAYPFSAKMWIDLDRRVPIKLVVDYSIGMLKQTTGHYDTDSPVTIEAPIS